MVSHNCGYTLSVFKANLGTLAEPGDTAFHTVFLHYAGRVYGLDMGNPRLTPESLGDLAMANLQMSNLLNLDHTDRDIIKRLAVDAVYNLLARCRRDVECTLIANEPGTQVYKEAQAKARESFAHQAKALLRWPQPEAEEPIRQPDEPTHSRAKVPPHFHLEIYCFLCGRRMITDGRDQAVGRWAGMVARRAHQEPITGSLMGTVAHDVTSISINLLAPPAAVRAQLNQE